MDEPFIYTDLSQEIKNLPEAIPKRAVSDGEKKYQQLAQWLLARTGWKITGKLPNIPKAVVIVAPHTSNWDGFYTFSAILALGIHIHFFGKKELYVPPFKTLWDAMHFIPLDRSAPQGFVAHVAALFTQREQFWLALAPEGTRKSADKWHYGFYHIAQRAQVPIVVIAINYKVKEIQARAIVYPTDIASDLPKILACYKEVVPKHPHWLSKPIADLKKS